MKTTTPIIVSILLISVMLFTGCQNQSQTTSQMIDAPIFSASGDLQTPIPTPAKTTLNEEQLNTFYGDSTKMQYEEYMSQERKFVNDAVSPDWDYFEQADEKTLVAIDGNTNEAVAQYSSEEYKTLGCIATFDLEEKLYAVANNNTLIRMTNKFENVQEILTLDKAILQIEGNSEIVYIYCEDKSFYLFHVASRTLTYMYENPYAEKLSAYSNTKVKADICPAKGEADIYGVIQEKESTEKQVYLYDTVKKQLTQVDALSVE